MPVSVTKTQLGFRKITAITFSNEGRRNLYNFNQLINDFNTIHDRLLSENRIGTIQIIARTPFGDSMTHQLPFRAGVARPNLITANFRYIEYNGVEYNYQNNPNFPIVYSYTFAITEGVREPVNILDED